MLGKPKNMDEYKWPAFKKIVERAGNFARFGAEYEYENCL